MPPALVVLVDGFTRLGGSQYVDSIHNGAYATYTVRDVVGHVDRNYRTIAARRRPRRVGKILRRFRRDAFGDGTSRRRLQRSHRTAAIRTFATRTPPAFATVQRTLEAHDFDLGAFVEAFERKPKRSAAEYTTMEMLAYAAAYSPRSATAFDLDLPFDTATGELRDDVFARWLAFDPAERVAGRHGGAERACGCAISIAAGATNMISTSARESSRGASASWGSRCVTRNSTTIIATSDIGTPSHFRRLRPFWISE